MKKTEIITCAMCKTDFEAPTWAKRFLCSRACLTGWQKEQVRVNLELTFAKEASKIHNNQYSYDEAVLVNAKTKIKIICPSHGAFYQSPSSHLNGSRCRRCVNEDLRYPKDQFLKDAYAVHGTKYDYSNIEYVDKKTRIKINCPKHGQFMQLPFQHTDLKSGCPECIKIIRSSQGEIAWLDYMGVPQDDSNRQVYLMLNGKRIIVDGLYNNTVYEYLGDYWHGNPECFKPNDLNKSAKKTFGELYKNTFDRIGKLRQMGYNVEYIWESQWQKRN